MKRIATNFALLGAVPELIAGLERADARAAATARRYARADVFELPSGAWRPDAVADEGTLGLFILEGLLLRDTILCDTSCAQLLGPGDVFLPSRFGAVPSGVQPLVRWRGVAPVRIAVLDQRFAHVVSRWPEIQTALLASFARSSHQLTVQLTLTRITRLDRRLHVLLWHLAERWGHVDRDGRAHVVLPLSHDALARLASAARASVTRQLGELQRAGVVDHARDGSWWLAGPPEVNGCYTSDTFRPGRMSRPAARAG